MKELAGTEPGQPTVAGLCRLFGRTKQAYYKPHVEKTEEIRAIEVFVVQFVLEQREKDPGISGKKLWYMYKRYFSSGGASYVGRDKFTDIVTRNHLSLRRRFRRPRTTDSTHGLPTFPNLVKDLIPTRPNQVWVTDITYQVIWKDSEKTDYCFCYISLITDAYTKEIIAWTVGESLETCHSLECLQMALARLEGQKKIDLIHHSDRGVQYASHAYVDKLYGIEGIRISMTEDGNPKDNPIAERQNNTLKNELFLGKTFFSIEDVRKSMAPAIKFYNEERPHMSLGMITPSEAAKREGELPKKWRSFREEYIKNAHASKKNAIFASQFEAVNHGQEQLPLRATSPSVCNGGGNSGQDSNLRSQPRSGFASPTVNQR